MYIQTGEDDMKTQHGYLVAKILVTAAIAVGSCVGVAAPASASPSDTGADPSPFGGLICSCANTGQPDSRSLAKEVDRGLRQGFPSA